MKICANCNSTYTEDKKFCLKCGAQLIMNHQLEPREAAKKNVFEDRLKVDPLNIEILHEYAQFLFKNLLFSEANTVLFKILAIRENDGIANELLFKSYFKLNLFKEALEIGKQLLSGKPTDIFLLQELAEISEKLGNSDKVSEYYDKILSLDPANSAGLYHKALNFIAANQLEKAIEIFKNLHLSGQNDRIANIYAGIDKALNRDYETAIKILSPILSDETSDDDDANINRGVLYLTYSLSQSSAGLLEFKKWMAKINLKTLTQNYHLSDEQTYVVILESIVNQSLNEINQSPDVKDRISELSNSYLGDGYLTIYSNLKFAEIWYSIGNKQVEFSFLQDAVKSFQKASELVPGENKYRDKSLEIEKKVIDLIKKRKRKVLFWGIGGAIALTILIIAILISSYRNHRGRSRTIEVTVLSDVNLEKDPNGKSLKEAKEYHENVVIKDCDNNVYHTVTIGTQVWMVENLKTTKFNDGTSIPNVADEANWGNLETPGYCWYDNDKTNKEPYGALYNYYAVKTGMLAPKGWHIPSLSDCETLITFLGGNSIAGKKLKETGTSHWEYQNTISTNETGFTALPGGCRLKMTRSSNDGLPSKTEFLFSAKGLMGKWWLSNVDSEEGTCCLSIIADYRTDLFERDFNFPKTRGYSVRCIKD